LALFHVLILLKVPQVLIMPTCSWWMLPHDIMVIYGWFYHCWLILGSKLHYFL
jgi:hypothetical protein